MGVGCVRDGADALDCDGRRIGEVIDDDRVVTRLDEFHACVAADEACSAGYEDGFVGGGGCGCGVGRGWHDGAWSFMFGDSHDSSLLIISYSWMSVRE